MIFMDIGSEEKARIQRRDLELWTSLAIDLPASIVILMNGTEIMRGADVSVCVFRPLCPRLVTLWHVGLLLAPSVGPQPCDGLDVASVPSECNRFSDGSPGGGCLEWLAGRLEDGETVKETTSQSNSSRTLIGMLVTT